MGKKLSILIICVLVLGLAASYRQRTERHLGETLVQNAYSGNLLNVKDALEHGAALHYVLYLQDPQRQYGGVYFNALQAAASGGNEDVINFLLEQGLDINAPTPQGWTPLIIAVRDGQAEAAKLLIYRKADLNAQTDLGATALMMAATQKFPSEKIREDLLVYMLKRGADPNQTNAFGYSAFYYAAAQGQADTAEILHAYGAAPSDAEKQAVRTLLKGKKDAASKKILQLLTLPPKTIPAPQKG